MSRNSKKGDKRGTRSRRRQVCGVRESRDRRKNNLCDNPGEIKI